MKHPSRSTLPILTSIVVLIALISAHPVPTANAANDILTPSLALQSGPSVTAIQPVNVRSGPGTDFFIVGTLSTGQTVPLKAANTSGEWWYVSTTFGDGWVSAVLVTALGADGVQVKTVVSGVVTVGVANVRSGAGLEAARLGKISQGQRFEIIGRNATGSWLEIRWQYGTGWVAASTLDLGNTASATTLAQTSETPYVVVMATHLNVRSGPGVNYSIVATVNGRDTLPVLGRTEDGAWFQVQTSAGTGWLSSQWVVTRDEYGDSPVLSESDAQGELSGPVGVVNTGALNMRSGPGAAYTDVGTLEGGTQAQIVGRSMDWGWWLLKTPSGTGWVNAEYIIARGDTSQVPYVEPGGTVNATTYSVAAQAPPTTISGPVAFVATGALNIRSGPDGSFDKIGSVYAGTRLPIIGQSTDLGWWQVDSPFGQGWVTKLHIIPEGDTTAISITQ